MTSIALLMSMPSAAPAIPVDQVPEAPLAERLRALKLVNYYPSRAAWQAMWERWDANAFRADMARIRGVGGNSVRLIVFPGTTGFPTPRADRLAQLREAVQLAKAQGLGVQLTLFDYWNGYKDIAGSQTWARAVLAPFAGDPGVAFVELRNEINFDDAGAGAWARAMVPFVRDVSQRPVTLSVKGTGGPDNMLRLKSELGGVALDLFSFHYYADPAKVTASHSVFQRARDIAGATPLYIGETGVPSIGWTTAPEDGEYDQALFYRTVGAAARALGLGAPAPWMLNDLAPEAIPSQVGNLNEGERNMGLFRVDGTAKPAAAAITQVFSGGAIDATFNNGFETAAAKAPALPAGWRRWWSDQATFARDTTVRRSGTASARISGARGDANGKPSFYISPPSPIVVPGGRYNFGGYSRAAAATGRTRLAISWYDANGKYLGQIEGSDWPKGTTSWTDRSVTGIAPATAAFVQLHLKSSDNTGTVWFDDVRFLRMG